MKSRVLAFIMLTPTAIGGAAVVSAITARLATPVAQYTTAWRC
jgi:hypothetical protein